MPTLLHGNSQFPAQGSSQGSSSLQSGLRSLHCTKAAIKMTSLLTPGDTFKSFPSSDFSGAFHSTNTDRVPTVCQALFQVQAIQKQTNNQAPLLETVISSLKHPFYPYRGVQMLYFFHLNVWWLTLSLLINFPDSAGPSNGGIPRVGPQPYSFTYTTCSSLSTSVTEYWGWSTRLEKQNTPKK